MKAYRNLLSSIILWIVSSEHLRSVPRYRAYAVYTWSSDFAVALTGLGFAHPILGFLSGAAAGSDTTSGFPDLGGWSGALFVVGIAALIFWAVLKVYVTHDEGVKRATLAESCRREFHQLRARLPRILQEQDPRAGLTELREKIDQIVTRHAAEGAWPERWDPFAPGIDAEVAKRVDELCARFASNWVAAPATDQLPQGAH